MAASYADLAQRLWRNRVQMEAIGLAAFASVVALTLGVKVQQRLPAARAELARSTVQLSEISDFRRAFQPAAASEDAREAGLADSLHLALPRDLRLTLAEQIASLAEGSGLRDVRVRLTPADSGAGKARPELADGSVTLADYTLSVDCLGSLGSVLSLAARLPASTAVEYMAGTRTKGDQVGYHLTLVVFETPAAAQPAAAQPAAAQSAAGAEAATQPTAGGGKHG
jgi:hypothetical protein